MKTEEFLVNVLETLLGDGIPVEATRTLDDRGVLITVLVPKASMPFVVGKEGQMALALRTLMRAVGSRWENARISLKIDCFPEA
jgi:predicted RNA-binding protein YlqC (UPF0109 family)